MEKNFEVLISIKLKIPDNYKGYQGDKKAIISLRKGLEEYLKEELVYPEEGIKARITVAAKLIEKDK